MSVNEIRDFIFGIYYKQIGFSKKNSYYSINHFKNIFAVAYQQVNRKNT